MIHDHMLRIMHAWIICSVFGTMQVAMPDDVHACPSWENEINFYSYNVLYIAITD